MANHEFTATDRFTIACRIVMLPIFTVAFIIGCLVSALIQGFHFGIGIFEDLY